MSCQRKPRIITLLFSAVTLSLSFRNTGSATDGNWNVQEELHFENQTESEKGIVDLQMNSLAGASWQSNTANKTTVKIRRVWRPGVKRPNLETGTDDLSQLSLPRTNVFTSLSRPSVFHKHNDSLDDLFENLSPQKWPSHAEAGFQSDYPARTEEVADENIYGHTPHIAQDWLEIRLSAYCSGAAMTLTAKGRGYTNLLVDRVDASPVSVLHLPSHCGFFVRATWKDLVLIAPYDGCYILHKNDSYVLPLLWWGRPVRIFCPMTPASSPASLPGFCSHFGMVVEMKGAHGAMKEAMVKVNGKWVPFVSDMCAYCMGLPPEDLLIIPFTALCAMDGGSLTVLLDGRIFILSCQPPLSFFFLPLFVLPVPSGGTQTPSIQYPHPSIPLYYVPPELDMQAPKPVGATTTPMNTKATAAAAIEATVPPFQPPTGHYTSPHHTPYNPSPYLYPSYYPHYHEDPLPPVQPTAEYTTRRISVPKRTQKPQMSSGNQLPQLPQVPIFPVLPTASPKMLPPSLSCTKDRFVVVLPSAKMESIKVKDVKRNVWVPVISAPADCEYSMLHEGKWVALFSPLPACHMRTLSPSILSLSLKFWDPALLRHRTLQLQCSYTSPQTAAMVPTLPWTWPTSSLKPKPVATPSQPSKPSQPQQSVAPPPLSEQSVAPPPLSEQSVAPPPLSEQSVAPPPLSEQSVAPPPLSEQSVAPPPLSEQSVAPPPLSEQSVAPPPLSEQSVAPPPLSEQSVAPPPLSEQSVAPPPLSEQSVAPPPLSEQSVAPPPLSEQSVAPPPFSQPLLTLPFYPPKPTAQSFQPPKHILATSWPNEHSLLPEITPLLSQTDTPQVRCYSQNMSVSLPPGPITGLTVHTPCCSSKEHTEPLALDKTPNHCGYMVKEDQDGYFNILLPYTSCHMVHQDGQYKIVLKYQSAGGHTAEALLSCQVPTSKECNLPVEQQLPCGFNSISAVQCHNLHCCYSSDTATCYYPMDECTADRNFVFSIPASLTDPPLSPAFLVAAGNSSCTPQRVVGDSALFKIPLDGCGVHRYEVGNSVIYMLEILNTLQSLSVSYGTITRDSPFRLLVECRYLPGAVASVGYLVKSPSLIPSIRAQGVFGVQLRIAKDQQYSSYYPQYHRPLRKLLGKPLYLEVRLLNPPDPSMVLLVHYCVAYPRSAHSVWILIYDGCPNPLDVTSTLMSPPPPQEAVANHVKRFTISTFQFLKSSSGQLETGGLRKKEEEEIYFMCATEVCLPSEDPCVEGCFSQPVESTVDY